VIPRRDPIAPEVTAQLADGRTWTRTRRVELGLTASDEPGRQRGHGPVCEGVASTGTPSMMVGLRSDFEGATWQPFASRPTLTLADQPTAAIWVKVKDGAGNESPPVVLPLRVASQTELDEAIALEERALDRLDGAEHLAARTLITSSLVRIAQSKSKMLVLLTQKHDKRAAGALVSLNKIAAEKTKAWALLHTPDKHKAREALEAALELERSLAVWAEAEGIEL
jgi:hypothetical protein